MCGQPLQAWCHQEDRHPKTCTHRKQPQHSKQRTPLQRTQQVDSKCLLLCCSKQSSQRGCARLSLHFAAVHVTSEPNHTHTHTHSHQDRQWRAAPLFGGGVFLRYMLREGIRCMQMHMHMRKCDNTAAAMPACHSVAAAVAVEHKVWSIDCPHS